MAFPVINSYGYSTTAGTGNVPARTAGDALILIQDVYNGSGSKSLTIGALDGVSWNLIGSVTGTVASTTYLVIYYLFAGTTGGTTTVSISPGGTWNLNTCVILDVSGNHSTAAPEGVFIAGQDPASLTPSWGSDNTLWIAAATRFGASPTTDPTSYTNAVTTSGNMLVSYRNNAVSSENPGAFTGGSGLGSAATIGIRPSALVIPNMVSLYHQMRRRKS